MNQQTALSTEPTFEWSDALQVVSTNRINAKTEPNSSFADDKWNLAPLGRRGNAKNHTLNFLLVDSRFRELAKIYMWLAINEKTPKQLVNAKRSQSRSWIAQGTLASLFRQLSAFLDWLDEDVAHLSDVSESMLNDYAESVLSATHADGSLAGKSVSTTYRRALLNAVWRLHLYADRLPEDERLITPPWLSENLNLHGKARRGNTTDELGPEVYGPLLFWAVTFVEDLAPDIIAALERRRELDEMPTVRAKGQSLPGVQSKAHTFLADWSEKHGTFPGCKELKGKRSEMTVSLGASYMIRITGVQGIDQGTMTREFRNNFSHVPVELSSPLDTPITGQIDSRPWIPHINYYETEYWVQRLREACLIIIGLGTGLRPEEFLSLTARASKDDGTSKSVIERIEAPDGQVRWAVHGRLFKGQTTIDGAQRLDGIPVVWETIETGAKAVQLAMELSEEGEYLFPRTHHGHGKEGEPMLTSVARRRLGHFAEAAHRIVESLDLPDAYRIPNYQEITPSQFRRTTLAMIEDQDLGLLAGAHQAKHLVGAVWETETMQGYGDTSRRGQLVHERRAALSVNALRSLAEQVAAEGSGISGPARERAVAVLQSVGGEGALLRITDDREFTRRAKKASQKLYEVHKNGAAWFCVHDRTQAACGSGEDPELGNCQLICPNKAYSDSDLESIELRIETLEGEANVLPKPAADRALRTAEIYRAELARARENTVYIGMPTTPSEEGHNE